MGNRALLSACVGISVCNGPITKEYHVTKSDSDINPGIAEAPFLTISRATMVLNAGDIVTVRSDVYREWVSPHNSGWNRTSRIVCRAAPGEDVRIKGPEEIEGRVHQRNSTVRKVMMSSSVFGDFNPFAEKLWGGWLDKNPIAYRLGEVFLGDKLSYEVGSLSKTGDPQGFPNSKSKARSLYQWCAEVGNTETVIWVSFRKYNPNKELIEVNAHPICFLPREQGTDYITVQSFKVS